MHFQHVMDFQCSINNHKQMYVYSGKCNREDSCTYNLSTYQVDLFGR